MLLHALDAKIKPHVCAFDPTLDVAKWHPRRNWRPQSGIVFARKVEHLLLFQGLA
jgi:hypothetical protein